MTFTDAECANRKKALEGAILGAMNKIITWNDWRAEVAMPQQGWLPCKPTVPRSPRRGLLLKARLALLAE